MSQPWDFNQATNACREASQAQRAVETTLKDAFKTFAEKDEAYRKALSQEIVKCHNDGIAWSTAPDIARGDPNVARLRRERDIAEGVKEAIMQSAWRRAADRKDAQRFSDWSARKEIQDGYNTAPEPEFSPPIGGRK